MTPAKRLYNLIVSEVQKLIASKRVTEDSILELDQKINYEAYIREKKDAILEDRKKTILEDDQKSHVSIVKEKYQGLKEEVEARSEARSKESLVQSFVEILSNQTKDKNSAAGGKLLINERLLRDFPDRRNQEADQSSMVSGFESEIDEWAALNKYALLKEHYDEQTRAEKIKKSKEKMRQELIKQQQEFLERKDEYKADLEKYFKEQQERNDKEDVLKVQKKEETEKQIKEINKWRIEHAKQKQQRIDQENKERIKQELEVNEKNKIEQEKEAYEAEKKKKTQL